MSTSTLHPVDHIGGFAEITEGVGFVPSFANVSAFDTEDGLVLVDTGSLPLAPVVHGDIRRWTESRLNTAIYSHGHIDHVFGVPVWEAEATEQGWPAPEVIAHHALPARFDRYIFTAGYNTIINRRQFGFKDLQWPINYRYPDRTYHDTMDLSVGGVAFSLRHEKGETDDHTITWQADTKVLCCGDLFIWASPNAGNPQKVQRYPREWAQALRRMLLLDAEYLLPGHGLPVVGAHRVRQALTDTADLLDSLVDQTLAVMNAGGRLDDAIHSVRPPAELEERPYLRPVYDEPEFVVHTVWRQYGGWWDGNPADALSRPASEPWPRELARAGRRPRRAGRLGSLELLVPLALGTMGTATIEDADHALRLAGHLAESAWLASTAATGPCSGLGNRCSPPGAARAHVDHPRPAASSTGPLNESVAGPAEALTLHPALSPDPGHHATRCPATSSFSAGFDSVSAVDSSLTSPSVPIFTRPRAPESCSYRRSPTAGGWRPWSWDGGLAFLLTGCTLPTFGEYKGATTQGRTEFHLWQGFFIAGIVVGGLVLLLILWAIFRYRRKSEEIPRQTQYHTLTEIIYTIVPIVIVLVLFVFTVLAENKVDATPANPGAQGHQVSAPSSGGGSSKVPSGVSARGAPTPGSPKTNQGRLRQGDRSDHPESDHGRPNGHERADQPQITRRPPRLLRSRVQLQPLRQPGLHHAFRLQRPAPGNLPGPVHAALRPVPLAHVLQREVRVPGRLRQVAARTSRLQLKAPTPRQVAQAAERRERQVQHWATHPADLIWEVTFTVTVDVITLPTTTDHEVPARLHLPPVDRLRPPATALS